MRERDAEAQAVAASVRTQLAGLVSTDNPGAAREPDIPGAAAAAAAKAVRDLPDPLQSDPWIYRMVVGGLVIVVFGSVFIFGAMALRATGTVQPPDALVALSSGALGALAGLLAPSPVRKAA